MYPKRSNTVCTLGTIMNPLDVKKVQRCQFEGPDPSEWYTFCTFFFFPETVLFKCLGLCTD